MMTREEIETFIRETLEAHRDAELAIAFITRRWVEDSNDTWREAVEDDRRASDVT